MTMNVTTHSTTKTIPPRGAQRAKPELPIYASSCEFEVRVSSHGRRESRYGHERRLRGHPLDRAALPREPVAEGQAGLRELGQGAAAAALRCRGRGGRSSRALAARGAHRGPGCTG